MKYLKVARLAATIFASANFACFNVASAQEFTFSIHHFSHFIFQATLASYLASSCGFPAFVNTIRNQQA